MASIKLTGLFWSRVSSALSVTFVFFTAGWHISSVVLYTIILFLIIC